MLHFGSCMRFLVPPLIALGIVGCGNTRQLQSVTLNPALADARNFSNGQSFV